MEAFVARLLEYELAAGEQQEVRLDVARAEEHVPGDRVDRRSPGGHEMPLPHDFR